MRKRYANFAGNISHHKIPKYIEFIEEYPMTASGKDPKVQTA